MDDWRIERLASRHERREFSCGQTSLDNFLRNLVGQYEKRNLGRTYVAVTEVDPLVRGYYTLASSSVTFQSLPEEAARKLPRHPVPVILLARLAVDTTAQGQGLGSFLLLDGLSRSLQIAEQLGIHAIEVHAIDESASAFYRRYGFVPLVDSPRHLYLPVNVARQALQPE